MLLSCDVFDTCLTRDVAVPTDIFYLVGEQVLKRGKQDVSPEALEDFVAARGRAYDAIRTAGGREDVLLADIWKELCRAQGWLYEPELAELELAIESDHLFPVVTTRSLIEEARRAGKRVVFISDTYFPKAFVAPLLTRHGFMQPGDALYTSGETGRMKYTGNLFRHMLAGEKIPSSDVTHVGDNDHSDFRVPRRLGIKTVRISAAKLGKSEQFVLREPGVESLRASRIAGGIRKFRAAEETGGAEAITELVAGFVGPVTLGFAAWALAQAQRDGVKRLYFLARDCQLAFRAAQLIAPEIGKDIECRYLYHSRQALFFPLITEVDEQQLWWLRRDFELAVLERLLAKLELSYEDVAPQFEPLTGAQRGRFTLTSDEHWKFFWSAIQRSPLRERILAASAQRREAMVAYLRSEGLLTDGPWAVVDLGWHLSCQRALQEHLQRCGRNEGVRGYYLGLMRGRTPVAPGTARGLFYEHAGDRQPEVAGQTIFSHIVPLEFILGCADHPTVHHYELVDGVPQPVFRGGQLRAPEIEFARKLHDATLRFVRANLSLAQEFQDEATARLVLATIMDRFALHPDLPLVAPLQKINAAGDQNLFDARPLIGPVSWAEALRLTIPGRFRKSFASGMLWREGSLAVSPPLVRGVVNFGERAKAFAKKTWFKS